MSDRIPLGAPGIYFAPETPLRALTGERMDICAFAGVAPRGPVRVPVVDERPGAATVCADPDQPRHHAVAIAVDSWADYVHHFGGFEGPGRLPYAVASFFDNGGRRAWVIRVVHRFDDPVADAAAVARGVVPGVEASSGGGPWLHARSEGGWGAGLRASLSFSARPLEIASATMTGLVLSRAVDLHAGSLLRLTLPGGVRVLRFVTQVFDQGHKDRPEVERHASFDLATAVQAEAVEVVTAALRIDDGDGREEHHQELGLSWQHPRWMATVLCSESQLVFPAPDWVQAVLTPDDAGLLPGGWSLPFTGGRDRYRDIVPEDFFDLGWTDDEGDRPHMGIHAIAENSEISLLVVPDLYSPGPLMENETVTAGEGDKPAEFVRCEPVLPPALEQVVNVGELDGLTLDPELPGDLVKITELQRRLVDFAEEMRDFVVLLDVPPRLGQRQILGWRARLASPWAAAYHPWIRVARQDDGRDALIRVNPSAVAAGIIARQEELAGVQHGPANAFVRYAVDVDDRVAPARHDELHQHAINVFLRERDGILLTAARTLSHEPEWRQLSVRRLMTMLRRAVDRQMQWAVFEPNNARLRAEVRTLLGSFLRRLYKANAFKGASEREAYFVHCDEALNPPPVVDAGRLICEVGVAPAEPLEFLVLKISREGDRVLTLEAS